MNIFTHDDHLKGQLRRAKRLQMFGLLAVILSFILSFGSLGGEANVWLVFLAYPFLLVGFPLWTIGRGTVRRLQNAPRADLFISSQLKGLNNKYSLHHYVPLDGRVVPHLLVTPNGLIVMQTSDAYGPVSCTGGNEGSGGGDKWKSRTTWLDRITGLRQPVGNPTKELDLAIQEAKQLLAQSGKPDVPVTGVIVFTRNPDLTVDGCIYPAIPLSELKGAVRELQAGMEGERTGDLKLASMLTNEDRRRINVTLSPVPSGPTPKPATAKR